MKIAISAPSGSGKTTLVNYLKEKYQFIVAKSCTTREKRGENDDEYNFINEKKFLELEKNDYFIETECIFDNYYGTPKHYLQMDNIIFNVDVKGIMSLKQHTSFISIFVIPPSMEILKERLIQRGEENIIKRLARVKEELNHALSFDFIICNDRLNDSYKLLDNIIGIQKHTENSINIIKLLKS